MKAVKQTCALALALGALAAGCGGDDKNNDGDGTGTGDSLGDAGADGGGSGFSCTSYTKPKDGLCGGSHCEQSPEQLRADTPTTAKCGADEEVAGFCSLKAVDVVGDCAVETAFAVEPDALEQCAGPKLPEVSAPCLDCFVDSAKCAKEKCFNECLVRETYACDECRVREGCITSFYACAGFVNPLPADW